MERPESDPTVTSFVKDVLPIGTGVGEYQIELYFAKPLDVKPCGATAVVMPDGADVVVVIRVLVFPVHFTWPIAKPFCVLVMVNVRGSVDELSASALTLIA